MNELIFSQIPVTELARIVADELLKRLPEKQRIDAQHITQEPRLHGDKAAAKHLKCTVQTVGRLRKDMEIPYHKVGRKYYYYASEIDAAFKVDNRRFGELRGKRAK